MMPEACTPHATTWCTITDAFKKLKRQESNSQTSSESDPDSRSDAVKLEALLAFRTITTMLALSYLKID